MSLTCCVVRTLRMALLLLSVHALLDPSLTSAQLTGLCLPRPQLGILLILWPEQLHMPVC